MDSNMLLEKFNINKSFMSATGVDIQNGLSNSEMEENLIKQYITSKATEIFILADHSKMGKSTLLTYCDLSDINKMFTDKIPPKDINDFCQKHNIAVYF
ncbi:hypothetical protein ACWEWR_03700 [Staphylococcus shinii]|nr:hypothetical protein [Staphylococcus shinii]